MSRYKRKWDKQHLQRTKNQAESLFKSKGSKNNKVRTIAVSKNLQQLLQSLKTEFTKSDDLVFPSPTGKAINYDNFARRAWSTVVDPINPDTTPYIASAR